MITQIKLTNFIIVKSLHVDFERGLQIITGETGAGKSILLGAVDIIFAAPVNAGVLLDDSKPALLEATFSIEKNNELFIKLLSEHDVDISEPDVTFSRQIESDLRTRSFINGRRVSRQIIKEFRQALIDFHSQRDQIKLFDTAYQREVLDSFGDLVDVRGKYAELYHKVRSDIDKLRRMEQDEKEQKERIKLYEYQSQELEEAELRQGEDEALQSELSLLNNAEEILNDAAYFEQTVYENENSVFDLLSGYIHKLSQYEESNQHIGNAKKSLEDAVANLEDSINEVRAVMDIIEVDSSRIEQVEERLNLINTLKVKYKFSIPEMLAYHDEIKEKIETYSSAKDQIINLQKEIESQIEELNKKAEQLSVKRQRAALKFATEIKKAISRLAIPDAEVELRFTTINSGSNNGLENLDETGKDEVEIYFSANKGVKMQPLKVVASGGELSRFLLSIKKILSDKLDRKTIILDEIDAGIGGRTAELLGDFIHEIGKFHQVICITHLPQIATFADRHFSISKISKKAHPEIWIKELDNKEKREEIARMLAGSDSDIALQHAEEILIKKKESL
jgi:DNA repair protein RecN (Recombination protein N)